ncbi:MAG: DUF262 domain-containing protein [Candidatus Eisenbacteria bacterium]|nr:DUF262 domain-containing protein [Candidatus Eisenbacteria bacterium]
MSATLFKEISYSLAKLTNDIEMGEIGLPDIERPFVWPNAKVCDLLDSMHKGFPVGYLLFWVNALPGSHRQIGTEQKQEVPHLLVIKNWFRCAIGMHCLRLGRKWSTRHSLMRAARQSPALSGTALTDCVSNRLTC